MPIERSHAFIRRHRVALMDLDSDYRCITTRADRNKVREAYPDLKRPALLAVMGLPHTGKEPICEMLGFWLRCPVYNIESPLDILSPKQGHIDDEEETARLQRLCFNVVCQMAEYHLCRTNYGVNCAIVSAFFFDYKWQLDSLLDVIAQGKAESRMPRLLIIECRRKNKFQWEKSVEKEGLCNNKYWYQPKCWKDVEEMSYIELMQQKGDSDHDYLLTLSRSRPDRVIKKLFVDPFEDISHNISELGGCGYSSLFTRAIKHLLTCDDEEGLEINPIVVDYAQWRRRQLEECVSRITNHHNWCRPGDCIFEFTSNLVPSEASTCEICEEKVANTRGGYYYCKFCSLNFHESCATKTTPETMKMSLSEIIQKMMKELHNSHACYSCIDKGKRFSSHCNSCLFRTFIIKSRLLPVIFNHNGGGDDHPLSLRLIDGKYPFMCTACGLEGTLASYGCHICKSQYHLECLRLPLQTKNQHGGHIHTIDLKFSCVVEDDEYEWCLVCYKDIDPVTWVYTCQDCDYVAHLYCIFPTVLKESQHLL